MSGWLEAMMAYFFLDSIGLLMLIGKRVRYTVPLVAFCIALNTVWSVVAAHLIGHLR